MARALKMRPISVLLTHEVFPPDIRGGGEYIALRVATGLQDRGMEVKVLTTGDPANTWHQGVQTERLPIGRYGLNFRVGRIIAAAQAVDVLQTFNYHACIPTLIAARYLSKPVVCEIFGLFGRAWLDMRGPAMGRLYRSWERFIISRPYDRTVFLSEASRAQGLALGAAAERSTVNPPGIEFDKLDSATVRKPFVLYAGKFDVRKGIRELVKVAAALPDISFHAIGWGDGEALLREANLKNLTITVESPVAGGGSHYRNLLRDALVLLFPSHSETFGLVVAEAMASGCAIVSTIDTIPFSGALVAPGNVSEMIDAIRRMWANQPLTRELGLSNRTKASAYTWNSHVDRLVETYESLLASRRASPPSIT
jgi:glycosyltransferase involved in cell wall biosynthesis